VQVKEIFNGQKQKAKCDRGGFRIQKIYQRRMKGKLIKIKGKTDTKSIGRQGGVEGEKNKYRGKLSMNQKTMGFPQLKR